MGDVKIGIDFDSKQASANAKLLTEQMKELTQAVISNIKTSGEQEQALKQSSDAQAFAIGKVMIAIDLFKAGIGVAVEAIKSLSAAFVGSINEAVKFEKALTDIKTIAPTTDMQALSKSLLDVSSSWGVDKITAANAQYDIMSSGITDAGEAFKVFEGAAKLAVATGAQTSETAKTITAAINAWGMSASDVGQVMDSLAITTQDGVVRMSELGPVFGQVAATAAGAGVSLQELNSGIAALTLGGTPAAQAGTQLKAVIAGLLKPSEELAAAFKAQAGQSTAAYLQANGLAKTLEVLKVVTKGSAEETSRLFGSQEAVAGLLPLITTQSDNFTKSLNKQNAAITEGGKVTQEMADIVSKSASFQIDKMTTSVGNLATEIGMNFTGVLAGALSNVTEFVDGIRIFVRDNEQSFKRVAAAVSEFITEFSNITKAIIQSEEFSVVMTGLKDITLVTFQLLKEAAKSYMDTVKEAFKGSSLSVQDYQNIMMALKEVVVPLIEGLIKVTSYFAEQTVLQYGQIIRVVSSAIGLFSKQEAVSEDVAKSNEKMAKAAETAGYSALFQKDAEDKLNKSIQEKLGTTPQVLSDLEKTNKLVGISTDMEKKHETAVAKTATTAKKAASDVTAAKKAAVDAQKALDENEAQSEANKIDRMLDYTRNYISTKAALGQTEADNAKSTKDFYVKLAKEEADEKLKIDKEYEKSVEDLDKMQAEKKKVDAEIEKKNSEARVASLKQYLDLVSGLGKAFSETISGGMNAVSQIVSGDLLGGIKAGIEGVLTGIKQSLSSIFTFVVDKFFSGELAEKIKLIAGVFGEAISGVASLFSDAISTAFTVATQGLSTSLKAVTGGFLADFAGGVSSILQSFDTTLTGISSSIGVIENFSSTSKTSKDKGGVFGDIASAVTEFASTFSKKIPDIVKQFVKGVPQIVSSLVRAIPEIVRTLASEIGPIITAIAQGLPEITNALIASFPMIVDALIANLPALFDALIIAIPPLISSVITSIIELLPTILPKLLELVMVVILEVIKNLPMIITAIMEFIPQLIAMIPVIIQAIVVQLPAIIQAIIRGLPDIIVAIIMAIPSIINSIIMAVPSIIAAVISEVPGLVFTIISKLVESFPAMVEQLWYFISDGIEAFVILLWEGIKTIVYAAGDFFASIGGKVWDAIKAVFFSTGDWLAKVGTKIWDGVKSGFESVGNFFENIGKKIWDGLKGAMGSITDWFTGGKNGKNVFERAGDWVADIFSFEGGLIKALSNGGLVSGRAPVAGDNIKNDIVPAMLSPGELVIPRSAMSDGMAGIISFARDALGQSRGMNMASGGIIPGPQFQSFSTGTLESRLLSLEATIREIGFALAKTSLNSFNLLREWDQGLPETRTI